MYYSNSCPEKDNSNVQPFASTGLADRILATGLAEFEENLAINAPKKKKNSSLLSIIHYGQNSIYCILFLTH